MEQTEKQLYKSDKADEKPGMATKPAEHQLANIKMPYDQGSETSNVENETKKSKKRGK
jgi:hypothetical protein